MSDDFWKILAIDCASYIEKKLFIKEEKYSDFEADKLFLKNIQVKAVF